ncbi:hypothetical protein C8R47DRAFT_1225857 [Mycena vitilis]|nr:hypothetical protein C8R47DRAFT_1225857 [Mycena vitilis]
MASPVHSTFPRPKPVLSTSSLSLPFSNAALVANPPQNPPPAPGALSGQKELSSSQSAGIKAVEQTLLVNNGGRSSGEPLPPLPQSDTTLAVVNPVIVKPPGPASNQRPLTVPNILLMATVSGLCGQCLLLGFVNTSTTPCLLI